MIVKRKLLIALASLWSAAAAGADFYPDTRAYNLAHGRVVFNENCLQCHEQGRKGAPVLDDLNDWLPRLDRPLAELIQHAVEGHEDMPPKGDLELSDQDVAAAVAFVVDRTRNLAVEQLDGLPPTAAGGSEAPEDLAENDAVMQMLMLLLGKEYRR